MLTAIFIIQGVIDWCLNKSKLEPKADPIEEERKLKPDPYEEGMKLREKAIKEFVTCFQEFRYEAAWEAIKHYRFHDNLNLLFMKIKCLILMGDTYKAKRTLLDATPDNFPDEDEYKIFIELGYLYFMINETSKAKECFLKVVRDLPESDFRSIRARKGIKKCTTNKKAMKKWVPSLFSKHKRWMRQMKSGDSKVAGFNKYSAFCFVMKGDFKEANSVLKYLAENSPSNDKLATAAKNVEEMLNMVGERCPYVEIGIKKPVAELQEVRENYFKLIQECHPSDCAELKEIVTKLSDPVLKMQYDFLKEEVLSCL